MSTFNAGYTTQGSSNGLFSGLSSVQISLGTPGTVQSCSFWTNDTGGNHILMGVYSDSSGVPLTLLAGSASTLSVTGLNTIGVTATPLTVGTYWIAFQNQNPINAFYQTGMGNYYTNSSLTWTGSLPATFPAGSGGSGTAFSFYMTLLASGGGGGGTSSSSIALLAQLVKRNLRGRRKLH